MKFLVEYTVGQVWKYKEVKANSAEEAKSWVRRYVTGACNLRASKIA